MVRAVKKELISSRGRTTRSSSQNVNDDAQVASNNFAPEDTNLSRRVLRSMYLKVKTRINDERDEISQVDSNKFKSIIDEVDGLHQLVQKPREQVADAEALYDLTSTLVCSVKAYSNEGLTPADFVSCLLRDFGQQGQGSSSQSEGQSLICWKDIGHVVSHVFRSAPGCCTMVGPMNTELKQRKNAVRRKHTKPTENAQPEELDGAAGKEKTDTDKNMGTMFDILVRYRKVKLENIILNRSSFAQTVENLFALSFLVKDGRAKLTVDEDGHHIVKPKNAPSNDTIASGDASISHFIFRYDFRDWKLMLNCVGVGEELMPHRYVESLVNNPQENSEPEEAESPLPTTPIRKLCRNRGLVMQEQTVVEDSPECQEAAAATVGGAIRKGKRKLR